MDFLTTRLNHIYSALLVLMFCGVIFFLLLEAVRGRDRVISPAERRVLNVVPAFSWSLEGLTSYPDRFNNYYSDHFGFREFLAYRYFRLLQNFDVTESANLTVGIDGWYFLGSMSPGNLRLDDPMGDVINANLYAEEELAQFARNIVSVRDWLASKGIEYLYVIAPNKHTVYFDKLPSYIEKLGPVSATDQLVGYLKRYTTVNVLDLRQSLQKARNNWQVDLYYRTDTHWNYYGANIAQYGLMRKIEALFPDQVEPVQLAIGDFVEVEPFPGQLTPMGGIMTPPETDVRPRLQEPCGNVEIEVLQKYLEYYSRCESQSLNVLVFRDSFCEQLMPYTAKQFKSMHMVYGRITLPKLLKFVGEQNPDLVIEQLVERKLPYIHTGLDPEAKSPD